MHPRLEFVDMGLRLCCTNKECGVTFVMETKPKSWMAATSCKHIMLPGQFRIDQFGLTINRE